MTRLTLPVHLSHAPHERRLRNPRHRCPECNCLSPDQRSTPHSSNPVAVQVAADLDELVNDPAATSLRARQDVESAENPWRTIEGVTVPQTADRLNTRSRVMLELYRSGAYRRQDQGPRQQEPSTSTTPTQQDPGQASRTSQSSSMHQRQPSNLAPGSQRLPLWAGPADAPQGRGRSRPLNPQAQGLQPVPRRLYPLLIPQLAYAPPPHFFRGERTTPRPTAPGLPLGRGYDADFLPNLGRVPRPIRHEDFGRAVRYSPPQPIQPRRFSPPLTFTQARQRSNTQGSVVGSHRQNSQSPARLQQRLGSLQDDLRRLRLGQQEERPSETEQEQDDPAQSRGPGSQRGS